MNGNISKPSVLWNFNPGAACNAKVFIPAEHSSPDWTWDMNSLWLLGFKEAKL